MVCLARTVTQRNPALKDQKRKKMKKNIYPKKNPKSKIFSRIGRKKQDNEQRGKNVIQHFGI